MGDLIVMTRPMHSVRREVPSSGSAHVLFFTGVRYTRTPDVDLPIDNIVAPRRATKPRRGPGKSGDKKRA